MSKEKDYEEAAKGLIEKIRNEEKEIFDKEIIKLHNENEKLKKELEWEKKTKDTICGLNKSLRKLLGMDDDQKPRRYYLCDDDIKALLRSFLGWISCPEREYLEAKEKQPSLIWKGRKDQYTIFYEELNDALSKGTPRYYLTYDIEKSK